jgi:hypothetical protein
VSSSLEHNLHGVEILDIFKPCIPSITNGTQQLQALRKQINELPFQYVMRFQSQIHWSTRRRAILTPDSLKPKGKVVLAKLIKGFHLGFRNLKLPDPLQVPPSIFPSWFSVSTSLPPAYDSTPGIITSPQHILSTACCFSSISCQEKIKQKPFSFKEWFLLALKVKIHLGIKFYENSRILEWLWP